MNNTIQLYVDEEKQVKGFPLTSPDRVIDSNGKSIKDKLKNNVKFDVVGGGTNIPPIDGGNAELVEKVESITEQLDKKANKIPTFLFFDDDFNFFTKNIDIGQKFKNVIEYINSNGGATLIFNKGVYNFNEKISLPSLSNITLLGNSSLYSNNNGTIFQYSGNGDFLEFESLNRCVIGNICIQGNSKSNNGVIINQAIWSDFNTCIIKDFSVNLYLKKFAYLRFNTCNIICDKSSKGILIGDGNFPEFLYFNNCAIDGGYPVTNNSTLIEIKNGHYIYFNNCDICNTLGLPIKINPQNGELSDIYFDKCTLMHVYGGVEIGNGTDHFKNVNFINCLWEFDGDKEALGFTVSNKSNSYTSEFIVKGLTVRASNKTILPTYILNFVGGSKVKGEFEIIQTNYSLNEITITGNYFSSYFPIKLPQDVLKTTGRFSITGNGGKVYTISIASKSPFTTATIPAIINEFSDSGYFFKCICNSVQNGEITLKIISNENVPKGTSIHFGYSIIPQPHLT